MDSPTTLLRIPDIIMKKRNGLELNKDEIDFFIQSICELNNNSAIQESQIGMNWFVASNYDSKKDDVNKS